MTYRKVQVGLWHDEKIAPLSPDAKYLWLYLLTNPHTHLSGIYVLPEALGVHETGLTQIRYRRGIEDLSKAGVIQVDDFHPVVWVKAFFRHQARGEKAELAAAHHIDADLPKCGAVRDFLLFYPSVADRVSDRVSAWVSDGASPQEQEQKQDQKQEQDQDQDGGGAANNGQEPKGKAKQRIARRLAKILGSTIPICVKQVESLLAADWPLDRIEAAVVEHGSPGLAPWDWTKAASGKARPTTTPEDIFDMARKYEEEGL